MFKFHFLIFIHIATTIYNAIWFGQVINHVHELPSLFTPTFFYWCCFTCIVYFIGVCREQVQPRFFLYVVILSGYQLICLSLAGRVHFG